MPPLLAVLGPTATGKSALALALAEALGGEIVNCDSTAIYRGFDIGTDKLPVAARRGIPHHLIDTAEPDEEYTAAAYARDAAAAIAAIHARGRVPIVAGGTGFYYRALIQGIFEGPGRHLALRARLARTAERRGTEFLWRMVRRLDPPSAVRIQPRDRKRLERALEVFFQSGRPMSAFFAETRSHLPAGTRVCAVALTMPAAALTPRIAARVDDQLARGVVDEVTRALAAGIPETARPLTGLVYRQILEMLKGKRDLTATRELIVRENRRYAKRQLIWLRKEPNLAWFSGPGEALDVQARVLSFVGERQQKADRTATDA